jgi:LacI family transcriptional regulator
MTGTQQPRPTLRDVAREAGVSFKTVSRVVNGEGGVSADLLTRVERAVGSLGYRPDDRARRLRQGSTRSGTIGFALVDVANPFFSSVLRGIEEVARRHDSLVLSGSTDGRQERENQLVEAFVGRRVDGLIVVSAGSDAGTLRAELDRGTPLVFLDLEPHDLGGDLVRSDHLGGATRATQHLIDHGHTRIAFFGDRAEVFSADLRLEGYECAMREAGLAVDERHVVRGRHEPDEWQHIICEHMVGPDAPSALFTAQNFITIGAARALHQLDLHHRIAQVGFDEIEMADLVEPGITTIPQHPLDLGRRAAERLFERIAGSREPATKQIIASDIIERGSGEIRPPAS